MNQSESSPARNIVAQRFAECERILRELKQTIEVTRETRSATPQEQRGAKVHELKRIVSSRGRATVADVRRELQVSLKTANRIIHQCAFEDGGVLLFERTGNTNRLVLVRPTDELRQAIAMAQMLDGGDQAHN
jgi:hypothetical protein